MPKFCVCSNALLVYSGDDYTQALAVFSKQAKQGRLVILYHYGQVKMQSGN